MHQNFNDDELSDEEFHQPIAYAHFVSQRKNNQRIKLDTPLAPYYFVYFPRPGLLLDLDHHRVRGLEGLGYIGYRGTTFPLPRVQQSVLELLIRWNLQAPEGWCPVGILKQYKSGSSTKKSVEDAICDLRKRLTGAYGYWFDFIETLIEDHEAAAYRLRGVLDTVRLGRVQTNYITS